jgi:hypothetical protein
MVTFLGVYFTRLCFKLNNLTGQKFDMSELKLSWPVTLTANPPAFISCPEENKKYQYIPSFPLKIPLCAENSA